MKPGTGGPALKPLNEAAAGKTEDPFLALEAPGLVDRSSCISDQFASMTAARRTVLLGALRVMRRTLNAGIADLALS